MYAVDAVKK